MSESGPLPDYGEPAGVATDRDDDREQDREHDHDRDFDREDELDGGAREVEETGLLNPHEPAATAVAQRLGRRPRDMVISIAVLLVVVFALFGLYRCLGGDEATTVDPGSVYEEARDAGAFPVLTPKGLSDDWKSVTADYQPASGGATLRVGWRGPDGGTFQLIESNLVPATLITRELGPDAVPTGASVDEGGRQWQVYNARNGETAYVFQEAARTVLVTGKASEKELREFVRALS